MKIYKVLPVSFLATMAVLSGLAVATAQSVPGPAPIQEETNPQAHQVEHVDYRGSRSGPGGHGMFGQILEKVDTDGDRSVTQAEIDAFRAAVVTDADVSGEGDISLDEFETIYLDLIRNRMVDAFQNLDSDGDGMVTQAEMDNRFGDVVNRMDRNGDSKLNHDDRGRHGGKGQGPKSNRRG